MKKTTKDFKAATEFIIDRYLKSKNLYCIRFIDETHLECILQIKILIIVHEENNID